MSDIRSEILNVLASSNLDASVEAEVKLALDTSSTRGNSVGRILDDSSLNNTEKADQLSVLAITGPGGVAGAIAIGIIIGILL